MSNVTTRIGKREAVALARHVEVSLGILRTREQDQTIANEHQPHAAEWVLLMVAHLQDSSTDYTPALQYLSPADALSLTTFALVPGLTVEQVVALLGGVSL